MPFSWIYGLITFTRNKCYDFGCFKSFDIPVKSICVGNLSTGGTGKTPHIDLLINLLLQENKKIATLSRGYGRKTKGILEVFSDSNAIDVGDEPLFYKKKHHEQIRVIVAEERRKGVEFILNNSQKTDIILLDDAFQHRAISAGLNILITEHKKPFYSDFLLPAGNLRENKKGIQRADCIIISKCPQKITPEEKEKIKANIDFNPDRIFFSKIEYDALKPFRKAKPNNVENVLLVTGIGNPSPLFKHLSQKFKVHLLQFNDHHIYKASDIVKIHQNFDTFASGNKIIVTTEKDFMRLKNFEETFNDNYPWFYQPIKTIIDEEKQFNLFINEYVNEI